MVEPRLPENGIERLHAIARLAQQTECLVEPALHWQAGNLRVAHTFVTHQ